MADPQQGQYQYVKLPDGSYGKFALNATDDQIRGAISKDFPDAFTPKDGGAAAAAASPFATSPAHAAPPQVTGVASALQKLQAPDRTPIRDVAIGAAKSVGNSANNIGKMLVPDAAVRAMGMTPPTQQQQNSYFAPTNTPQAVGKVAGDIGQFFLPGPGEELAASKLAPLVGKALPAIKIGAAALGSGAINKAEGGSFTGGAAGGALGAGIGQGIKSVAPLLAETALGVRAGDRALGRTPGQAIIDETSGILPGTIANQASGNVNALTGQVEKALANAPDGSLATARKVANSFVDTAVNRNTPESIKRTTALQNVLTTKLGPDAKPVMIPKFGDTVQNTGLLDASGQPITRTASTVVGQEPAQYPETVPARTLLNLKRGIGEQSQAFNPAVTNDLADSARANIYHALDSEMDRLAPQTEGLNSRITSLIPVAQRAGAADLNAGVLQRVVGRLARPTGALAGAGIGGYEGSRHGGATGAAIGAGLGLVAPEILANPATLMTEARMANAAGPTFGKLANASGQQFFRPKK